MTEDRSSLDRPTPVEGDLPLPRPPGALRRFWARHPWLTDSLIAAIYVVPAVAFSLIIGFVQEPRIALPSAIAGIVVVVLGGATLVLRRRRPWLVVAVAWAATLLIATLLNLADVALIPFAMYALAAYGSMRSVWIGFAGSVIVGSVAGALAGNVLRPDPDPSPLLSTAGGGLQFAVPLLVVVLIGINVGNRRRYVAALLDRAATLVREREQLARLAASSERSRIAREMHDIVSHSLTVMVTLAEGAAAIAAEDSVRASEGMRLVGQTGRSALTDMRRMLGVLNDTTRDEQSRDAAALEPQPGIADLDPLIERFRLAGLPLRYTTRGRAPADPNLQLAVYRIVQESLTNCLRHAQSPDSVDVELRYRRSSVTITISDDGSSTPVPAPAGGHGLVGMRERVALYSGTVESGPLPGGGWRVSAVLNHSREATS